jgi:hypothetical protein
VPDQIRAFFLVVVATKVGNGECTLFWTNRWLQGKIIVDLAPHLSAGVSKRRSKTRTVREALLNNVWILDFSGGLSVGVLTEFLQLWDTLQGVSLQPDNEDTHTWRLTSNGQYSTKSAYDALFLGGTRFGP